MSLAGDVSFVSSHSMDGLLVFGLAFNNYVVYFKIIVRMWCGCYACNKVGLIPSTRRVKPDIPFHYLKNIKDELYFLFQGIFPRLIIFSLFKIGEFLQ